MKPGNLFFGFLLIVVAGIAWICFDMNRPSPPIQANSGRLGAALSSSLPVLVEFYADWCGPCRAVAPEVEKLAGALRGKAEVIRLNVDQNRALAEKYGVRGIPCFIAFKNGRETSRQVGGIPPGLMRSMIGL